MGTRTDKDHKIDQEYVDWIPQTSTRRTYQKAKAQQYKWNSNENTSPASLPLPASKPSPSLEHVWS